MKIVQLTIVIIILCFCKCNLHAQNNSIKLYANLPILNSNPNLRAFDYNQSFIKFSGLSLAISTRKELWRNEYEIGGQILHLDLEEYSGYIAQFRYQRARYLKKKFLKKGQAAFGIGAKIYLFNENRDPITAASFPIRRSAGGIAIGPFAHFEYDLTKNIFVDINSNLLAFNLGFDRQRIENPLLTDRQQTTGGFDFDALAEHLLRVGIGFRFGKKE